MSRFQFVDDLRNTHEVKWLCEVLEITRSSYYAWVKTKPVRATRAREDMLLAERVRIIQSRDAGGEPAYGVPRVTAELNEGVPVDEGINHKRVARVMRLYQLNGIRLRRRVRTTQPEPAGQDFPDLVGRDFTAEAPNLKYVGDITYLPLAGGQNLYLATVIDCASRKLAGYAVADHMLVELVEHALKDAANNRGSLAEAVFHSDRGSVYTSKPFAKLCTRLKVKQSMGGVGSSADNALAESFNAALKREVLDDAKVFIDADWCWREVFRWARRYNTVRRHSYCKNVAPSVFEEGKLYRLAA